MHDYDTKPDPEMIREHMRSQLKKHFGIEDTIGIELFSTIRMLGNLLDAMDNQQMAEDTLSGPRMRLMMRLMGEEDCGNKDGLTPTALSRFQRVSKNTISSLLRGLEDQGLIQRDLDPQDYRIFRIQLTPAGRELIQKVAPQRLGKMNEMASVLEPEEREQLILLLGKLQQSLLVKFHEFKEKQNGG